MSGASSGMLVGAPRDDSSSSDFPRTTSLSHRRTLEREAREDAKAEKKAKREERKNARKNRSKKKGQQSVREGLATTMIQHI